MIRKAGGLKRLNIVILERNTVGADVSVECFDSLGNVTSYDNTAYSEIAERVKDADIVIANKSKLCEETLKNAKNIGLIAEFATGFDNIDIDYCKKRGIKVCNVSNYSTPSVVQHTFALAFYVLEHLSFYDDFVKSGQYRDSGRFTCYDKTFTELSGKTWGIIGMGNIGKGVAKVAESFGARVIYYSTGGKNHDCGYEEVDFNTLLKESDIISCHCPLNEKTRNIIDRDAFDKMKTTAILVNVARGGVVNNEDLYKALVNNKIAGAGLDVITAEPITDENPLSNFKDSDRLIITPHMAWASVEARRRCVLEAFKNVEAYIKGEDRNLVY